MESNSQSVPEQLVEMWDSILPHYSISVEDLCNPKPCFLIGVLSEIFPILGINRDAILSTKLDGVEDNHSEYYADLIPAINVTRTLNHLLESFHVNTCLFDVVYPYSKKLLSFLRLLINYCLVMKQRQEVIDDRILKLYEIKDEIDQKTREKNILLSEVNQAVAAKASRSGRMRKVNDEIEVLLEKLREETALKNEELAVEQSFERKNAEQEAKFNSIMKENDVLEDLIAKKQAQIFPNAVDLKIRRERQLMEAKELNEEFEAKKTDLWTKKNADSYVETVIELLAEGLNHLENVTSLQGSLITVEAAEEETETAIEGAKEDFSPLDNETKMIQDEDIKLEKERQCNLEKALALLQEATNDMKLSESQHAKTCALKASNEEHTQRLQTKMMMYDSERHVQMEELNSIIEQCSEKLAEIEDTLMGDVNTASTLFITKLRNLFVGNK